MFWLHALPWLEILSWRCVNLQCGGIYPHCPSFHSTSLPLCHSRITTLSYIRSCPAYCMYLTRWESNHYLNHQWGSYGGLLCYGFEPDCVEFLGLSLLYSCNCNDTALGMCSPGSCAQLDIDLQYLSIWLIVSSHYLSVHQHIPNPHLCIMCTMKCRHAVGPDQETRLQISAFFVWYSIHFTAFCISTCF